jgi:3-deoxy-7-phosphoheptulonate synthase
MSNVRKVKKLPSSAELVDAIPLSPEGLARVSRDRREACAILAGEDRRLLMIVGPCSAWPAEAVLEYGRRLSRLGRELEDVLKPLLRVYIQKPRTAQGWTGPLNQPDPFAAPDVEAGMRYCRKLMVDAIESGLAIADEALFTHNDKGFAELLTWVAIGARSTEDQEHRIWASAMDAPVGLKNPTSGSIEIGANSVLAAQRPHTAAFDGYQVETLGNPFAHLVLRGGSGGPNHHVHDLYRARRELEARGVANPVVLVDTSHDNSRVDGKKDPRHQPAVLREVLDELGRHPDLQSLVKGFLVESFLEAGAQDPVRLDSASVRRSGLSITDPCLGWSETEELLRECAARYRAIRGARVA